MGDDGAKPISDQWALLEEHFDHHARLIKRFGDKSPSAVTAMWKSGTNESGELLSQFEIDALVERYCELFGCWPEYPAFAENRIKDLKR